MNKRGIARVIEATIAVFILASFLFFVVNKNSISIKEDLSELARDTLYEASENQTLRIEMLNDNEIAFKNFVGNRIGERYKFETRICAVDDICGKTTYTDADVYSAERVIGRAIGANGDAVKIKVFIWR